MVEIGIPIYLDTNTLIDLLASIEDGFTAVETRSTSNTTSTTTKIEGKAGFGIKDMLSFFKIDLGVSGNSASEGGIQNTSSGERYHTYGSLMNRLLNNLRNDGTIKKINDESSWDNVVESDFVEIQGKFIPNPFTNSLKTISGLLNMILKISNLDSPKAESAVLEDPLDNPQLHMMGTMKDMIQELVDDLEGNDFQKYVIELKGLSDYKVVSYLFDEYIRDRAGAELPFGEFKMVGKIVRKISDGESIDLLQGSILGSNEQIIEGFIEPLSGLNNEGFKLPEIFTKVEYPAMQIIPVAVFI
ncbi:MAG: hypothetical protein Q7V10_01990 [Methanobacteriaceae archaeon]|nr:hypothetical protein [Methanobacteriaceae archaeon]MDO9628241.1 hypothetical protein [Methanobacteriaceae archaeon]